MEALRTKVELGDDAVFYSGGTELLLVMKLGLAEFGHLIDLKRIEELALWTVEGDSIRIGAAVTHNTLERDTTIRSRFPAFTTMLSGIGNLRVRTSGTLGGNLAFADPHSDPATFLTAVGGTLTILDGSGKERTCPVADFTIAPYLTNLEEGEIVTSLSVPIQADSVRVSHRHLRFRERPALTVTVVAQLNGGRSRDFRVALGSVTPTPQRLADVEALLAGGESPESEAVYSATCAAISTFDDADGSADYKRHLAGVIVQRTIGEILEHESVG